MPVDYNNPTQEYVERTYRAATAPTVVAAADTKAFFAITGSATKTIIVNRILISGGTLTAVAYNSYEVRKTSTAPSGGTATVLTQVPLDNQSPAGSATLCQVYTAVPTEGTLIGNIACKRVLLQATTAAAAGIPDVLEFNFREGETSGVVLRGITNGISMGFGAAPASAVTVSIAVEWTEIDS